MTHSSLHFQVQQLRAVNLQRTIESLVVFILGLFVSALLPSILIRYVYANQQLFEQPPLLDYIPLVSFVVAIGYFIYTVLTNLMREAQAKRLERQAWAMADECDDCGCGAHGHADGLGELQSAMQRVEAAAKPASRSTKARKTTRRK